VTAAAREGPGCRHLLLQRNSGSSIPHGPMILRKRLFMINCQQICKGFLQTAQLNQSYTQHAAHVYYICRLTLRCLVSAVLVLLLPRLLQLLEPEGLQQLRAAVMADHHKGGGALISHPAAQRGAGLVGVEDERGGAGLQVDTAGHVCAHTAHLQHK
jgi:hypothetical protein